MNLIPFDLERAKKGVPMITRDERPAKFIALLAGGQPAPLVVELQEIEHDEEDYDEDEWEDLMDIEDNFPSLENYYIDGRHGTVHDSPLDLFMEY